MNQVDRPFVDFQPEPTGEEEQRARPLPLPVERPSRADRYRYTAVTVCFVEGYCLNPPDLPPIRSKLVSDPQRIIVLVANAYDITPEQIFGKRKRPAESEARSVCYWLLRNGTNLTLAEVARVMKRPDHTSVIWGVKRCGELRTASEDFRKFADRLLAEAKGDAT